jgi:hypothetical protein
MLQRSRPPSAIEMAARRLSSRSGQWTGKSSRQNNNYTEHPMKPENRKYISSLVGPCRTLSPPFILGLRPRIIHIRGHDSLGG